LCAGAEDETRLDDSAVAVNRRGGGGGEGHERHRRVDPDVGRFARQDEKDVFMSIGDGRSDDQIVGVRRTGAPGNKSVETICTVAERCGTEGRRPALTARRELRDADGGKDLAASQLR